MTELGQMIYDDGWKEGWQKGWQEGLEQSECEKQQKGERKKGLFVVGRALEMGLEMEAIAELTDLSVAEIEALAQKKNN